MADESSSLVGRRIEGIEEAIPFQQQRPSCSSLSSVIANDESKEPSLSVPSPKQGQEIIQSFEKVRCSSETNGSSIGDSREVGLEKNGGDMSSMDGVNFKPCETFAGSFECEGRGQGFGGNMEPVDQANWGRTVNHVKNAKEEVAMEEGGGVDGVVGSDGIEGLDAEEGLGDVDVEGFLESKKKQLLAALEVYSTSKGVTGVESADGAGILGILKGSDDSVRSSRKTVVNDDAPLIVPYPVPETANDGVQFEQRNVKVNGEQESDGKQVKQTRREGTCARKSLETSGGQKKESPVDETRNMVTQVSGAQIGSGKHGDGKHRNYSREEMEALRSVNIVEQQKMWRHMFTGLEDTVVKEYGDLTITNNQKNIRSNLDHSRRVGRKQGGPRFIGERTFENVDNESKIMDEDEVGNVDTLDVSHSTRSEDSILLEEGCSGDDDSDKEFTSIQKPAFFVEGEPDFESGPPEDGLEYLRRVRWEAAHVPKVKVAQLDRSRIVKEQSVYMPQIPDIAKCPENLLPLKQWEDEFLADFSKLRQKLQFQEQNSFCPQLTDSTFLQNFSNFLSDGGKFSAPLDGSGLEDTTDQSSMENEDGTVSTSRCPGSKAPTDDSPPKYPTVASIVAMDCVARAANLREHIKLAEKRNTLSKNECLWLFALCAAVDIPVDADTCASLRSLLRKCASLRSAKSELDDEVIMLNILATISGRFFGQSES